MTLKSKFLDLLKSRSHITGSQAPAMSRETAIVLEVVDTELKDLRTYIEVALQNIEASRAAL